MMNYKKFLLLLLVTSVSLLCCGFSFHKKTVSVDKTKATQQVVSESYNVAQNDVWCITFQLIWNDFMDKFSDGKPVRFVGGNPPLADELNKKLYTKDLLSDKSYYITQGKLSLKLKKEIEKAIYKKFKEKSDILDRIDWNAKDSYLFYTMLKKDFTFLTPFDKLDAQPFNRSDFVVKYFGINKKSDRKLRNNADVIFYNNSDDFAVKLNTKENEEVILYRTDNKDTFENLYTRVYKDFRNYGEFDKNDILYIPNIDVNKLISYDELCGKKLKDSNYMISQALQTIKFKLDDKGGTLKSEAAMAIMKTSLEPPKRERYFIFNKPFVLFLKEKGKDKPYYAMYIDDTKYLVKK